MTRSHTYESADAVTAPHGVHRHAIHADGARACGDVYEYVCEHDV